MRVEIVERRLKLIQIAMSLPRGQRDALYKLVDGLAAYRRRSAQQQQQQQQSGSRGAARVGS